MATLTPAQLRMLTMVGAWCGTDLAEIYREMGHVELNSGLAWRNADRTADALVRRELIVLDGDQVHITLSGQLLLQAGR